MASKKGVWGGARPGAGRKPKAKVPEESAKTPASVTESGEPLPEDMLKLLQDIARGLIPATTIQVRAAIAAVQYTHTKRGDGGKKEEADGRAKKAASGRFGARPAPLKLVGGG